MISPTLHSSAACTPGSRRGRKHCGSSRPRRTFVEMPSTLAGAFGALAAALLCLIPHPVGAEGLPGNAGERGERPIRLYHIDQFLSHTPGAAPQSQPIAPLNLAIADLGDWIHVEWQEDEKHAAHREPLHLAVIDRTETGTSASGRRGNHILFLWFSDERIVFDRLDGGTGRLQRHSGPAGRAPQPPAADGTSD